MLFYVCVVCFLFSATRLGGYLVCILWSCLFSLFVLIFIPLKRRQQKTDTAKTKKKQIAEKNAPNGLFAVSAVVFTNSVPIFGGGLKNEDVLKTLNLKVKNWSKHESKTGPSMLRNTIGSVF